MALRDSISRDSVGGTSRRALLRGLAIVPVSASALICASSRNDAFSALHRRYDDAPAVLTRSRAARGLSRFRYHTAERYGLIMGAGLGSGPRLLRDTLHRAGFVAQQALSAHLLDVGFADEWIDQHIRHDVAKALAYANATGLGHDCAGMARLAVILSPFWKWGYHYDRWEEQPDDGGFTPDQIAPLVHALLDRVRDVTGHPRPKGWHRERQDVWS